MNRSTSNTIKTNELNKQCPNSTHTQTLSLLPEPLFENRWGSWHCSKFKNGGKCDLCNHTKESDTIQSFFFKTKFRIHGHLRHDFSPIGKIRWFIYSIEDIPCKKLIIGSTQSPTLRWANYKAACNKENSKSSGLSKHFMDGCPFDTGKEKMTLSS